MEPVGIWYHPIIVNRSVNDMKSFNGVKAMLLQDFYWHSLLKDMVPPESEGILLVSSNDCVENSFTYQINGPNAVYVSII
jgi:hypothetical protein